MAYIKLNDGQVIETNSPDFLLKEAGSALISAKEGKTAMREQARQYLLARIKPNDTVYCVRRHVSASGMRREIALLIVENGTIINITHRAAEAMDDKVGKHDGIIANGCGMDAGFHLVYSLGRNLWPNGTSEPHGVRNGEPDSDGGYAIGHRWI